MTYEISSIHDERIAMFASMTEAELRNRLNSEQGIFIAESPKVIRVALDAGYEPLAMLCEQSTSMAMLLTSSAVVRRCPSTQETANCYPA